jgi:hypothetical protein
MVSKVAEMKSKLAYYVSIELELYPGTSVSTTQKYAVKCQSTFERIREAYSDLFGFEYRPSALPEAYSYAFNSSKSPAYENKPKTNKVKQNPYNNTTKKNYR